MIEIIEKRFDKHRNPDLAGYCERDSDSDGSNYNAKMKCYATFPVSLPSTFRELIVILPKFSFKKLLVLLSHECVCVCSWCVCVCACMHFV